MFIRIEETPDLRSEDIQYIEPCQPPVAFLALATRRGTFYVTWEQVLATLGDGDLPLRDAEATGSPEAP